MKLKNVTRTATLFFALIVTLSCSHDDNKQPTCQATKITVNINGVPREFEAVGRGIDLLADGTYKLQLNADGYDTDITRNFEIELTYKKTGQNIIRHFNYLQYDSTGQNLVSGDFVTQEFQCNVTVNRATCFYATFSGTYTTVEGNTVTLTNGIFSYTYEDSFDE